MLLKAQLQSELDPAKHLKENSQLTKGPLFYYVHHHRQPSFNLPQRPESAYAEI